MQEYITQQIEEAVLTIQKMQTKKVVSFIDMVANKIATCFRNKGKILIAGNGGSCCDGMHFAEELTGQFKKKRKALPAICLSDPGFLTCTANDFGFENVFARGVEAYGNAKDIFIILTTSGNSQNLLYGYHMAKELGLYTIGFLGKNGGDLQGKCDLEWIVEYATTSDRIQEAHMSAIHIIIEMVEQRLFYRENLEKMKKIGAYTNAL